MYARTPRSAENRRPHPFRILLNGLRVHQWANTLVFVPLVTSHLLFDGSLLLDSIIAFWSFNFFASAGYVVNDLIDLEADRCHPQKRFRPFASSDLPLSVAVWLVVVCCASALIVAAQLPSPFTVVLLLYLVLSVTYSCYLKRVALVDVILLAGLYGMRIQAGSIAIGVTTSHWLLAFSMFTFLSLALMKRFTELTGPGRAQEGSLMGRFFCLCPSSI